MIANVPFIEKKFDEFNELMFGGELKMIPIELSKRKGQVASFSCRLYKIFFLKKKYIDPKFTFSTRYDYTERQLEDVIIHEMIHYYIRFKGMKDEGSHGPIYVKIMNEINQKFGRNITIKQDTKDVGLVDTKPKQRIIAVLEKKDGTVGIKVLPRNETKIHAYCKRINSAKNMASIILYMSTNPFFSKYPSSSALYIHPINRTELQTQLTGAKLIPYYVQV